MDAPAGEPEIVTHDQDWLAAERDSGRLYRYAALATSAVLLLTVATSLWVLQRPATPGSFLKPEMIAGLLIANLIPAIVLMVLFSRRIAMQRAERGGLGSGRLHTRLVALFSVIAAVPTVLVAIFASLLFQSGLEFWFSDRARNMLENSVQLARTTYNNEVERVANETVAASGDLAGYLQQVPIDSPEFLQAFGKLQVLNRNLSEAIIFTYGRDKQVRSLVLINPYERALEQSVPPEKLEELRTKNVVSITSADRIGAVTRLRIGADAYLYEAHVFDPEFRQQIDRANGVLHDYQALLARSRVNQLRFNAALLLGSLIIVALAIFAALRLADRLVRPVSQLAEAAGRIEQGDFTARVPITRTEDEIQTLAHAFNQMTDRLQEQTGELRTANTQIETRRIFIEAVLSSVTAGVIALDSGSRVLLINKSAETLLQHGHGSTEGVPLNKLSPELGEFLQGDEREANVDVETERGRRTLAIKRVRYQDGSVLTFDDITEQLSDQRSAAWSDIARRIAHEIKNPLTPISLAAERLQRRFGGEVTSDSETFERLTGTIVRQVGDLRRMVDEFSNFARMPKPVFRPENVHDIARQALFLHEVAHPEIKFSIDPATADIQMVCDRRQLSQALTNVVKNAVEAIESRRSRGEHHFGGDRVDLRVRRDGDQVVIDVLDTGIGLPEDRERLTEPYMTTRVRGTGLGLAIVKKIVEEHCGEIAFLDRQGGGTHVRIAFDGDKLESLEGESLAGDTPAEDGTYI